MLLSLPYIASKNKPKNTISVLNHCLRERLFPKINIEPKTVKNFLVVVIIEHGNGPNSATVRNIKYCPNAPAIENVVICHMVEGYLCRKRINSKSSPEIKITVLLKITDQKFILSIMCPDFELCSALIRSCTALVNPSIVNDNSNNNSPTDNCDSACFLETLPSLYINNATPMTIKKINMYFLIGYICKEKVIIKNDIKDSKKFNV